MKIFRLMAIASTLMPLLFSCSGGAGSVGTPLFGSLPGVYEKFQKEKDQLTEAAKNIKSEAEKAELIEKSTKMQEEWGVKIEESAKSLNGKPIELAESNIKVTEPISLGFDRFSSKSDLMPTFRVSGSAEVTSEIETGFNYVLTSEKIYIVGYDAEGQQVYKAKVGFIPVVNVNKKAVVKAGTPVEFDGIWFYGKDVEAYKSAKTLKLEILR